MKIQDYGFSIIGLECEERRVPFYMRVHTTAREVLLSATEVNEHSIIELIKKYRGLQLRYHSRYAGTMDRFNKHSVWIGKTQYKIKEFEHNAYLRLKQIARGNTVFHKMEKL